VPDVNRMSDGSSGVTAAAPAELLVKGARPSEVGDAEGNETDALLDARDGT
jgi:hypothetical protein